MRVSEEIDALRTLGLDPYHFLVFPRVIALVLVLPLLTILADVVGIAGGLLVGMLSLDLTVQRLPRGDAAGARTSGTSSRASLKTAVLRPQHRAHRLPARARHARRRRGRRPRHHLRGRDEPLRDRARRRDLHGDLPCLRELSRRPARDHRGRGAHHRLRRDRDPRGARRSRSPRGRGVRDPRRQRLRQVDPAAQPDRPRRAARRAHPASTARRRCRSTGPPRFGVLFQSGALFGSMTLAAERRAAAAQVDRPRRPPRSTPSCAPSSAWSASRASRTTCPPRSPAA